MRAPFIVCVLVLAACLPALALDKPAGPVSAKESTAEKHVPSQHAIEVHHSLHRPLDQSQVYWNFGGSTVLTKNAIRLTPAAQNRRGWLWNDYPLESNNWEIEFQADISSKPHFGGDGFGFWLLEGLQDPTYHNDPSYLNGDVFGIKNDFKGVGIVIDVYDNDARRDNPSVFVLYNPDGVVTSYNHDNDYADDMYKVTAGGASPAYTCTANVRNLGHPFKMMVRYIQQVMHVYIDTDDGIGYKFCLAVKFDKPNAFKDHHIAFTAITGQVADSHDVIELSTRYLSESGDNNFNDDNMIHLEETARCPTLHFLYWTLLVVGGFLVSAVAVNLVYTYKQLENEEINPVIMCEKLNKNILPHYLLHAVLCTLLLLGLQWQLLLLNLPLLAWHAYKVVRKDYALNPANLDREKVHGQKGLSFFASSVLSAVVYAIAFLLYTYRWVSC